MRNPFRYFKTSPEIIRLTVMMYVRFPLSLRQVEDLLHERGIDISYETVRAWWNRFGPIFANEIKKQRSASMWRLPQAKLAGRYSMCISELLFSGIHVAGSSISFARIHIPSYIPVVFNLSFMKNNLT
jgi:hypothetical protein